MALASTDPRPPDTASSTATRPSRAMRPTRPSKPPEGDRERAKGRDRLWVAAFLVPFLLLYLGFTLWPLVVTVYYSFFDWSGTGPLDQFVGGGNYSRILGDPLFWQAVVNTLLFAVGTTLIKLPLSLLAALVMTRKWLRAKRALRTVFFAPLIIPVAMAGLVFTYLLNPSNGALNSALHGLGLTDGTTDVFANRWTAMLTLVLISVWQVFGQYMIYWMAALQNVPDELYEAAELDGATEWQKLTRITLPLIRPVAVVIVMLALVNAMHVFGLVVTLTGGGPGSSTYVVSYFIYKQAFGSMPFAYGYASAAALLFSVMAFFLVTGQGLFVRRAQKMRKEYGV
ncbi:carbohydrate ABC transporter permease [Streptomyces sp. NBC_00038]|uniref:carbohydrate ABC transporter permease n=1 Tax=Streptomyces sp. NBC_00038 TaxID=2903615 RepID=UPI002257B5E3|nr:sugar ABC transporter permease [Streptomyces sp. NBC_00038]MCX5562440.1 ABC transporter permease subunit [Streptomyces sp. NBC_00038]